MAGLYPSTPHPICCPKIKGGPTVLDYQLAKGSGPGPLFHFKDRQPASNLLAFSCCSLVREALEAGSRPIPLFQS